MASIEAQDLSKADDYFEKALKQDPSPVLLELATYLESIGFYPQAKAIYQQIQSDFPEVVINLAQIADEDGDLEAAFLYLDEVDVQSDLYVDALVTMADLYDSEGLSDVAREKMRLACQLSDDPLLVFGLAELELDLEDYQSAITHYAQLDNRAILAQTGISTYERIGRAYVGLGKFEAAVEFLEKAIELAFDDQTVFELASLLYDQGDYQKANHYFKQLDTLSPDFFGYEYLYAHSLHEEHQTAEALRLLQQALSKNAFDASLLLLASQYSYELHDSQTAEQYLVKAVAVAEDDEEVRLRLTSLYLEEERYQDVIALDSDVIDHVLTKWHLAKAYRALEKDDQAVVYYDSLLADLSDNPEFLEDYSYYLRELGQLEKMRTIIDRYLLLVPDDLNMLQLRQAE